MMSKAAMSCKVSAIVWYVFKPRSHLFQKFWSTIWILLIFMNVYVHINIDVHINIYVHIYIHEHYREKYFTSILPLYFTSLSKILFCLTSQVSKKKTNYCNLSERKFWERKKKKNKKTNNSKKKIFFDHYLFSISITYSTLEQSWIREEKIFFFILF